MIINQIRQQKWKRIVQTTVYIPYFISTVVMVSILNIMLASKGGVISEAMKANRVIKYKIYIIIQVILIIELQRNSILR